MNIGFALITNSPFFDKIIEMENKYHDTAGFHNTLGSENNLPHITIFQGTMSEYINYQKIANQLAIKYKSICSENTLDFNDVVYVPEGWYFYECQTTEVLTQLHNCCLSLVKDYIVLNPNRLERNLSALTNDQISGIRDYGYRYAGKAFYPHITIGRTSSKKDEALLREFKSAFHSFTKTTSIRRITVYEMGPDGTHASTLYEVNL